MKLKDKRLLLIIEALKYNNGVSNYKNIYDYLRDIPDFKYENFKNEINFQGTVRAIIQENSSDSTTFNGQNDIFYSVNGLRSGLWGLRNYSETLNKSNNIIDIEGKDIETISKIRSGQNYFRNVLLNKYDKCRLCNIDIIDLLIASHIKPWKYSDEKEKVDVNNGLILCPIHDKLFDKGYISFDEKGNILISDLLKDKDISNLNINKNMNIFLSKEENFYMDFHRKNIFLQNIE